MRPVCVILRKKALNYSSSFSKKEYQGALILSNFHSKKSIYLILKFFFWDIVIGTACDDLVLSIEFLKIVFDFFFLYNFLTFGI